MNGFEWIDVAANGPLMDGPGKACFQWLHSCAMDGPVRNGLGKACF